MKTQKLLSTANAKLKKGEKMGWLTYGLSLAPSNLSGKNLCPHASEGCKAACLFTAGHGRFQPTKNARIKKTLSFLSDRENFILKIKKEIQSAIKKANKESKKVAFRLNVLSDLPWQNIGNIMQEFPDVTFYDYTPNPSRMIQFLKGELPKNYHLTFSRKENNDALCDLILSMGGNVAMVFDNVPETYKGKKVINGDESDLRFLDEKNVIVGLKAKGDGKKDTSGFVIKI